MQLFLTINYNWVVDRRNMPVEDLIRSQLQSEEEFADQRSSYSRMRIVVNFISLYKKSAPSFDLPYGTVMTKLKLFHVVVKNVPSTNFRDKLPPANWTKSLIFDLTKILLPKHLIPIY